MVTGEVKGGTLRMGHRRPPTPIAALLVVVTITSMTSCGMEPGEDGEGTFAFVHANVIPMDRERVLADHTVIVRDGRIESVGPTSGTDVPRGTDIVDATGRFLIPALADMHVHLEGEAWNVMFPPDEQFAPDDLDFERLLFLYVANGVATVEVMSALPEHVAVRDSIARGEMLGPRLVLSRMIDGPGKAWPPPIADWVATGAEGRQAVLDARQVGYDRMKVYSFLDPPTYDAILATAREVGMDVDGHVPYALSVERVVEAGQTHIVHSEEIMKQAAGDYSRERIEYFATILAESGTWVTPTLITSRNVLAILDDPASALAPPESRYLHPMDLGIWAFINTNLLQTIPQEQRVGLREGFEEFQQPLTLALHEAGAGLMTGTDALLPGCLPGFSVHDELGELVGAGLSAFDALRCSTTAPHEFLDETDQAGTIEPGKRADLVLLEADPLEDIANTRTIAGVMIRGTWLPGEEIEERLEALVSAAPTP
jgi:imidazolonepropionase-like amidohydrolase